MTACASVKCARRGPAPDTPGYCAPVAKLSLVTAVLLRLAGVAPMRAQGRGRAAGVIP